MQSLAFKLGTIKIPSRVILSPMAGITSLPFRMIARMFGCELAFTEMIDACSLSRNNKRTQEVEVLRTQKQDRPLGVQLLGDDPQSMLSAIEKLRGYPFDILDINAACPQKKITAKGQGAALLKHPEALHGLLKTVVKHAPVPVTVKMRLGWDNADKAVVIALQAEAAGIKALCVHGRTRMQGYSGTVNYEAIRDIKKSVSIPVIGSGDIFTPELARKMFDETGCDAIAVARGSLGNPWLFRAIKSFLTKGQAPLPPDRDEIHRFMKLHLELLTDFYGEERSILIFRKFYIWYTCGFSKVRPLRSRISQVTTKRQMLELIEAFRTSQS